MNCINWLAYSYISEEGEEEKAHAPHLHALHATSALHHSNADCYFFVAFSFFE
jgi:hypothetical protein